MGNLFGAIGVGDSDASSIDTAVLQPAVAHTIGSYSGP